MLGPIEPGEVPPPRGERHAWNWAALKPGDSFTFSGVSKQAAVSSFAQWLARGRYSVVREGDGWRFTLRR